MALARDRKAISAKIIDLNEIGLGASIFCCQPSSLKVLPGPLTGCRTGNGEKLYS